MSTRSRRAAAAPRKAVVIGGGLLGLEAAYGLAKAGAQVSVIHLMDRLMERQLDARAAAMLKQRWRRAASRCISTPRRSPFAARARAEAVALKDGREIAADLVVVAAGIRPNVELRDSRRRRHQPRHRRRRSSAHQHGPTFTPSANAPSIAASVTGWWSRPMSRRACSPRILPGKGAPMTAACSPPISRSPASTCSPPAISSGAPGTEPIVLSDAGLATYKKLVIADGRLVGAVLFGDTADGLWYLDLIRAGARRSRPFATTSCSAVRWPTAPPSPFSSLRRL